MGLASSDQQPDPIVAAGLGPQGDLLYMAPEQIQGRRGDPRSDIYTIGVLLYLANTGKLPFSAKQRSMQNWIQHKAKFVVQKEAKDEPFPEMIDIISKALSSTPEKRYQWVEDLQEDLEKVFPGMNS